MEIKTNIRYKAYFNKTGVLIMDMDRIKDLENLGYTIHRPIRYWINFEERKIFREDLLELDPQILDEIINKKNTFSDWLLITPEKELRLSDLDIQLIFGI